jgi:hypothetical protein
MRYKVYFASNARRLVEADSYSVDERTITFKKGDEIVLVAVLQNITCFHVDNDETQPVPLVAQCGAFVARV